MVDQKSKSKEKHNQPITQTMNFRATISVCLAGGNVARITLHSERMPEKSAVAWIRKEQIQH